MSGPPDEWRALLTAFTTFSRHIDQARTVNINSKELRAETESVAQQYFRQARPALEGLGLAEELETLDESFQALLALSHGRNAAASYKKYTKRIRKLSPKVTGRIELSKSTPRQEGSSTDDDRRIIETLENLVPTAARSYKQALIDLADDRRHSFRGPALELRETLRETLDHLAPDKEVMSVPGYAHEKARAGPTMKQKVRFILKARGMSKTAMEVPEQTTATLDEMVGGLTRSIYDRSSLATHIAQERKAVIQIRRYVVAILHDILEL